MTVEVYPKTIVYCPQNKAEQDGEDCKSCKFYGGYKLDTSKVFIICEFDKQSMGLYQ